MLGDGCRAVARLLELDCCVLDGHGSDIHRRMRIVGFLIYKGYRVCSGSVLYFLSFLVGFIPSLLGYQR
jgi:hypothetical protein